MNPVEWRPVRGFGDRYAVRMDGTVCNLRKMRQMATSVNPDNGYMYVSLTHLGRNRKMRLHKVVAEAFMGPCPPDKEINHRDGDKLNPHVSNLEYMTHAENMEHAAAIGLFRGSRRTLSGH